MITIIIVIIIIINIIIIVKNAKSIVDPQITNLMVMTDDIPWLKDQIKLLKISDPKWKVPMKIYTSIYI
jgi:hypothetical protein